MVRSRPATVRSNVDRDRAMQSSAWRRRKLMSVCFMTWAPSPAGLAIASQNAGRFDPFPED